MIQKLCFILSNITFFPFFALLNSNMTYIRDIINEMIIGINAVTNVLNGIDDINGVVSPSIFGERVNMLF